MKLFAKYDSYPAGFDNESFVEGDDIILLYWRDDITYTILK